MQDLINARERLLEGGYTCVLRLGEQEYTSTLRGVKPLVQWMESGRMLQGFCAADKVVGKATAYLYVLLGVKALYAHVISKSALKVLEDRGIAVEYRTLAEHIINRTGDGICPFEAAVMDIHAPEDAYVAIRAKMREMNITL